jgi:Zn-dependent membrane protease YugP
MDIVLILLILIIPAIAQFKVSSSFSKYKAVKNENGLTGQEVARKILDENGLDKVYVVETPGNLTDHYDPGRKVVRLSSDIYKGDSVASLSVAAHECGHAIQDKEGYFYMRFRALIFPVVKVCTSLSYLIIFIGLLAEALNIVYIGIALVATGLIFQIVTLPVEIDASKRAENQLIKLGLSTSLEQDDVKNMLNAAAMTYVAGVLSSALELLRLILIFGDDRR